MMLSFAKPASNGTAGHVATTPDYPAQVYPQVTFQQTSEEMGRVYKTALKRTPGYMPQVVRVDARTMERLRLANRIIDEIQIHQGFRTGNQWIDLFPDGARHVQQLYTRDVLWEQLKKGHPELSPSQNLAVATALTGVENCGGISHLAMHKLLQNGVDAPVCVRKESSTGHEFVTLGDSRMEKVIKVEAWAPFGTAQIASPDYLEYQTQVLQTEPPSNKGITINYGGKSLDEIERIPPKQILADFNDLYSHAIPEAGPQLMRLVIEAESEGPCSWNMLFGPEDPATQYQEPNAMPVSFNEKTVRYWEERFKNPQEALDAFINEGPANRELMKAAGYRAEGSTGR